MRGAQVRRRVAVAAIALSGLAASSADPPEEPPTFLASDVVRADLRTGEHHRVAETVVNDGYLNLYRIESDFGEFEVRSEPMLIQRVQEVHALAELDRVSKTRLFAESAAEAATAQITAIADFAERPVETVKGIPGGVKRMFKKYQRDVKEIREEVRDRRQERAEKKAAEEAAEEAGESTEGGRMEEAKELGGEAVEAGGRYAKKYFGWTRAEREWAQKLGIDPYTSNEILIRELKKVARVDAAGGFAMKFAPIPRIPGAGYVGDVNQLVWSLDPRELEELNRKRLLEMGIDEERLDEFFDSPWLSPSRQTRIVTALISLDGVEDGAVAIEQALGLESTDQAIFFQQSLEMLAYFHHGEQKLARLVGGTRVPTAMTRTGRWVAFASVDHICWTEEMREVIRGFLDADQEIPLDRRELVLRGSASALFRQNLERLGMIVREDLGSAVLGATSTSG